MHEIEPSQSDFNPYDHEPLRSIQRPLQYKLAKYGINASPEEAHFLFTQKIVHDAKLYLQQDLSKHGIEVSPDEAVAIYGLHTIHLMMESTGIADPQEAMQRIALDNLSEPFDLGE